jgi:hypothetical protein
VKARSVIALPEFLSCAESLQKPHRLKVLKALKNLSMDHRHPGLRTRRIQSAANAVYECRLDQSLRIVYDVFNDQIRCWYVGDHDFALDRIGKHVSKDAKVSVDDIATRPLPGYYLHKFLGEDYSPPQDDYIPFDQLKAALDS